MSLAHMDEMVVTGSSQAIFSEQVLLAGTFFSMSVDRKQIASLRAFVMLALQKNLQTRANYSGALQ